MRAPRRSDGHAKLFRKPLAATLFMFLGMTLILPLAPLIHWLQDRLRWRSAASTAASDDASTDAASAPLLASAGGHNGGGSPRRDGWLRQCALLLVPTLFDVVATATHKIGLMWLTVSVYQMLRGSQILYAALLSMLFLRRRLTRWHAGGLALVVSGVPPPLAPLPLLPLLPCCTANTPRQAAPLSPAPLACRHWSGGPGGAACAPRGGSLRCQPPQDAVGHGHHPGN